ncbi:MAG: preprotein translocase subunit YajC [Treponema sp.]|nr:preprotein translocase subunit YajC [Treponema sp.]
MDNFVMSLLMAAPQAAGEPAGGAGLLTSMIPFIAIIAIFYLLIIRPQNKKRKETEKMLASVKKGDKIVTIGGVHGTVHSVKESTVIVRVDENVKMEFQRSAISSIINPAPVKEEKEKIEDKSEKDEDKSEGQASESEKN